MISVLRRGTKVLFLLPMILPKRFDIFSPLTEGCSEGLDAFRFFKTVPGCMYDHHLYQSMDQWRNNIQRKQHIMLSLIYVPSGTKRLPQSCCL